ncbi:short chain dehydrogenase [Rothia kristinae]|nr:short chain dehydrogenase [Rothia kristinae]
MTSVAADLHQPMSGWYCASKAALVSLADTLRLELRGSGIDVVEIRPGPVDTGWQRREAQELREAARGGRYEALAEGSRTGPSAGPRGVWIRRGRPAGSSTRPPPPIRGPGTPWGAASARPA